MVLGQGMSGCLRLSTIEDARLVHPTPADANPDRNLARSAFVLKVFPLMAYDGFPPYDRLSHLKPSFIEIKAICKASWLDGFVGVVQVWWWRCIPVASRPPLRLRQLLQLRQAWYKIRYLNRPQWA